MAIKDILKSGVAGVVPALVADNPKLLQGAGLIGNIAYNQIENREEDKARRAAEAAAAGQIPQPGMKKGGKVSSASKRADGCAVRGKTKGRML